jgi:hypothetical protein
MYCIAELPVIAKGRHNRNAARKIKYQKLRNEDPNSLMVIPQYA